MMAPRKEPVNGEEPFSVEERRILREMMRTEAHVAWFWATVRSWSVGVAGTVAAVIAFRGDIKALISWFIK